ncbi:MAG: protein kinase [Vicinamibacterales bacterium]
MTHERWQRAKALFQAAVERPEAERAAFLTAAAGDDEALRREVESLLYSDAGDVGLLDRLPVASEAVLTDHCDVMSAAAGIDLSSATDSSPRSRFGEAGAGVRVGPYEVIAPLGVGGMGEVYRARDTTLHRDVALKVLSAHVALDPDRLARFKREAQTLASLNHPNIAAIYGLEESNGVQALVLELVEGDTLSKRLAANAGSTPPGLPIEQALDYAQQIAAALEAAHEKGITHCDLKPANIQVTPRGVVKLLDFGIAKVLTDDAGTTEATTEGLIAGTPGYMSPEQASGKHVDGRTDIWAFGCLLYELLTGKRAFQGETLSDAVEAVLKQEPAWNLLPGATPRSLRTLLQRCLQKDATRRLQAIADARRAIERAQRRWSRRRIAATAAAALAVLAIGTAAWWRDPAVLPGRSDWVQITNLPDSVMHPALSPDGRMVAFLRGPSSAIVPYARSEVYVKALPDGQAVQLTHDNIWKMSPVFSPDGTRIAYTTVDNRFGWDTWTVPVAGGTPQAWLNNASGLAWAGPGQLLFSAIKKNPHMVIVAAQENGNAPSELYVPAHVQGMAHRSYASPDRRWVLLAEMDQDHAWMPCRLVPMEGKSSGRQIGPPGAGCTFAAWSPDGRWMYLSAKTAGENHIWRQRFPDGEPEQITSGPTQEEGIAITPDGRSLVTAVALQSASLWLHDARGERPISLEGNAVDASFTPDGRKLVYKVVRSLGDYPLTGELRIADVESGRSEPLIPGVQVLDYDISDDGRQVVFEAVDRDATSRLWLAMIEDRSPPRPVPTVDGRQPRFGAGGDIFFRHSEGAAGFVYRVRADGSGLRKAIEQPMQLLGEISRDGRWVMGWTGRPDNNGAATQAFPVHGGPAVVILAHSIRWQWSRSGDAVAISNGPIPGARTYFVPLTAGEAIPQRLRGGEWSEGDVAALPGARRIDAIAVPGPSPEIYAFYRSTTQRNLYRIPIP